MTLLTLFLPCFWFLALPLSGLGAALGLIGLIASSRDWQRRGQAVSIVGLAAGVVLLAISGLLVMYANLRLTQALDGLRRF
jgi:hypothetical protein